MEGKLDIRRVDFNANKAKYVTEGKNRIIQH